jgi:hypothetical protein
MLSRARSILLAAWQNLFPRPRVSEREFFFTRALFAFAMLYFLPWGSTDTTQPAPVGLARIMDLTWLANPVAFGYYKTAAACLLFLYAAGVALRWTLPVLCFVQLLPYTLLNSQGSPHHGFQVLSLPLLALAVLAVIQQSSSGPWRSQLLAGLGCVLAGVAFHSWLCSEMRNSVVQALLPVFGSVTGWVIDPAEAAVFVGLAFGLSKLGRSGSSERYRSSHLFAAQWMIGATYFISVCSKMKMSDWGWFARSHYIVLDTVKSTRQSFYSGLDPALNIDPPGLHFFMQHPDLTRVFFSAGVLLEMMIVFSAGSRRLALLFGIATFVMHRSIQELMTLNFHTNEAMLAIFFMNLPYWLWCRQSKVAMRS